MLPTTAIIVEADAAAAIARLGAVQFDLIIAEVSHAEESALESAPTGRAGREHPYRFFIRAERVFPSPRPLVRNFSLPTDSTKFSAALDELFSPGRAVSG